MITAAIYDKSTGRIISKYIGPQDTIEVQCTSKQSYYVPYPETATHIINGEPLTIYAEPVPPSPEEQAMAIVKAVQNHLDATASARNYDGILSLCSYATSTDPVFAAEGQAGVVFRDACWRTCYQGLAEVEAGARTMPTPEEAVLALPLMVWP